MISYERSEWEKCGLEIDVCDIHVSALVRGGTLLKLREQVQAIGAAAEKQHHPPPPAFSLVSPCPFSVLRPSCPLLTHSGLQISMRAVAHPFKASRQYLTGLQASNGTLTHLSRSFFWRGCCVSLVGTWLLLAGASPVPHLDHVLCHRYFPTWNPASLISHAGPQPRPRLRGLYEG
jgi:hypothetical protein